MKRLSTFLLQSYSDLVQSQIEQLRPGERDNVLEDAFDRMCSSIM